MAWKGCTKSLVHTFAPTCASPGLSPFLSPILSACTIPTNSEHSIPQSSSRLGAVTSPQQQAPSQHSSFLLTPLQHSWWQISRATKSSVPHTAQCLPCRLPLPIQRCRVMPNYLLLNHLQITSRSCAQPEPRSPQHTGPNTRTCLKDPPYITVDKQTV